VIGGDGGHVGGRGDLLVGDRDGHQVLEALQGCLVANGRNFGAGITLRLASKVFKIYIGVKRFLGSMNLQNLGKFTKRITTILQSILGNTRRNGQLVKNIKSLWVILCSGWLFGKLTGATTFSLMTHGLMILSTKGL